RGGLCKVVAAPAPGRRLVESVFQEKDGLGSDSIEALHQLADGTLFVGTKMGLSAMHTGQAAGAPLFSTYTAAHGLPASGVLALGEDSAGSLWIGTDGSGAAKLVWNTFLTYTTDDGLAGTTIDSIFEDTAGRLCVAARQGTADLYVNEFDDRRFWATRGNLPEGIPTTAASIAIRKGCRGCRTPAFRCSPRTDRAGFGWGFCGFPAATPRW